MNKKSTGLLLSILGVLSLVLITAGVTYAFFSYTKQGVTENTISTGTITFYYDELQQEGNGISIQDALPMTDAEGKALAGTNEVFNFKVTSTVSGDATIPYEVTARMKDGSTIAQDQVKLYLTATGSETGTNHTVKADGTTVKLFSELSQTGVTVPAGTVEKTIFNGTVPARDTSYSEDFTLRMWINGDNGTDTKADYSPYEFVLKTAATGTDALKADDLITAGTLITSTDYYALDDTAKANYERIAYVNMTDRTIFTVSQVTAGAVTTGYTASEQFYQINGQTFTVTVNVYANATVVSGS